MTRDISGWLVALAWMSLLSQCCNAWIPTTPSRSKRLDVGFFDLSRIHPHRRSFLSSLTTRLYAALAEGYREYGERVIRQAGNQCGLCNPEDLRIEWKAGRIVVTVYAPSYVSASGDAEAMDNGVEIDYDEEYDDEEDEDDDDDEEESGEEEELEEEPGRASSDDDESTILDLNGDDSSEVEELELQPEDETPSSSSTQPQGIDVSVLARAINAALDDGEMGLAIAEVHEIEVTTPGASEELQGPVMFNAYKGFDVICRQEDPKTKKVKQVEGRLVERTNEIYHYQCQGTNQKDEKFYRAIGQTPQGQERKWKMIPCYSGGNHAIYK